MTLRLCALVLLGTVVTAATPRAEDALSLAPPRFASLDGIRVHYKSLGAGREAIVFVHGWACDLTFWRLQVPAFAGKARLLLLDLPGHGRSDKPERAYTMDLFARAVDAVLQDAGVERAVLVGHSMGTPVVRQFYRLYPRKTRALVAVDGSLQPFTTDPAQFEKFVGQFRGPEYKMALARSVVGMAGPYMATDMRQEVQSTMLATPQHVLVSAGEAMGDPAIFKPDRIDVPLLSVLAKSPFWTPEYEAFLRGIAREVEYRIVEGVGHFLMLEEPEQFNALLAAFLAKHHLAAIAP